MKILWHSNAPWVKTGYGIQTATFVPRIKGLGHDISISAFYGLRGAIFNLDGVKVLPGGDNDWGNDILSQHQAYHQFDLIVGLVDQWVLNPAMVEGLGNYYGWLPVDHDPVPPPVLQTVRHSRGAIVFSRFAQEQLKANGIQAHYVPHGIDGSLYTIIDKKEAREKVGFPQDKFVAVMVLANNGAPSRKSFNEQIEAFTRFHKHHPDSILYLHTDMTPTNGENIGQIIDLVGLPHSALMVVDRYQYKVGGYDENYMSAVYSGADVVLNATRGEGFGLPIVEAQMCGCPVIVGDWTAMPELCETGWKVGYSGRVYTPQGSYHFIPDISDIKNALEEAYFQRSQRDSEAIRLAVGDYEADFVTETYWKPVLIQIECDLNERKEAQKPIVIPAKMIVEREPVEKPNPFVIPVEVEVVQPSMPTKKCPHCDIAMIYEYIRDQYVCPICGGQFSQEFVDAVDSLKEQSTIFIPEQSLAAADGTAGIFAPTEEEVATDITVHCLACDSVMSHWIERDAYECKKCGNVYGEHLIDGNPEMALLSTVLPDITVIMPAYNAIDTIDRAIESVLSQDLPLDRPRLELIIVDDDSSDGTYEHLEKWSKSNPPDCSRPVKVMLNKPGGGPVGAFNAAIPHIKGKYVIKLDADDWFAEGALKRMAEVLDGQPDIGFVYGQCQYHGDDPTLYTPDVFNPIHFYRHNEAVGEVMYREIAHSIHLLKNRGFWADEDGREFGPHDWDFVLQLISLGWQGYAIRDQVLHHYTYSTEGAHKGTQKRNKEVMELFRSRWPQVKEGIRI